MLRLSVILSALMSVAGCALPEASTARPGPPPVCAQRPRGVHNYCDGEVPPMMLDCAVCVGGDGCVDEPTHTYCVERHDCDDRRCRTDQNAGPRNELLLVR